MGMLGQSASEPEAVDAAAVGAAAVGAAAAAGAPIDSGATSSIPEDFAIYSQHVESERDFYFNKLRAIEILVQHAKRNGRIKWGCIAIC